jgi:dsRNA-specific ribonuclease
MDMNIDDLSVELCKIFGESESINLSKDDAKNFIKFIIRNLFKSGITTELREKLLNVDTFKCFINAFIHKSFQSPYVTHDDFIAYEFVGDRILKKAVAFHIIDKNPEIKSEQWLTKILNHIISEKYIMIYLKDKTTFFNFIKYTNPALETLITNNALLSGLSNDHELVKIQLEIIQNVLKSFCGCICIVLQSLNISNFVGSEIAERFIIELLDKINLDMNFEKVFESVTRLKELYHNMNWPFDSKNNSYIETIETINESKEKLYTYRIYAWVLGNKSVKPQNKIQISEYTHKNKTTCKNQVHKLALDKLKEYYQICLINQHPEECTKYKNTGYNHLQKKENIVYELDYNEPHFKEFIREKLLSTNLFSSQGKNERLNIDLFLTGGALSEFKKCFTHKSVDEKMNYEMFEFLGDRVYNQIISFYILNEYACEGKGVKNITWLTKIFHYITGGEFSAKIAMENKFKKYLRYNQFKVNSINPLLEDCLEAFCGCILYVVRNYLDLDYSIGYAICEKYILNILTRITPDVSYENIFDPVTRLKELYQSVLKWPFSSDKKIDTSLKWLSVDKTKIRIYGWFQVDKDQIYQFSSEELKSFNISNSTSTKHIINPELRNIIDEVLTLITKWKRKIIYEYESPHHRGFENQSISSNDMMKKACIGALQILKQRYGVQEEIPNIKLNYPFEFKNIK